MTDQLRIKLTALLYAAVPLATAIAVDLGVADAQWQHYLAAAAAFLACFGINLKTGDRTEAVGGSKPAPADTAEADK